MRTLRMAAAFGLWVCLSGCIPYFLHPAYGPREAVDEDRLIGTWTSPPPATSSWAGSDTVRISRDGKHAYRVTYRARMLRPDSLVFLAHIFRVGTQTLIDLEPHPSIEPASIYAPVHSFYRVSLSEDTLFYGGLSEKWLDAEVRAGRLGCPVDTLGTEAQERWIFTCPTEEVRRVLQRAVVDSQAMWRETFVRSGAGAER